MPPIVPSRRRFQLLRSAAAYATCIALASCSNHAKDSNSGPSAASTSAVSAAPLLVTSGPTGDRTTATQPPTPIAATTPLPGTVTVTLHDGASYVGRFVSMTAFVPCDSPTAYPFTANDTARLGGQCHIAYSAEIGVAVTDHFGRDGGPTPLINSLAVSADGGTAIATFVRGKAVGEALLTKRGSEWTVMQASSDVPLAAGNTTENGVSPSTVKVLQSRLKFDVTTPLRNASR